MTDPLSQVDQHYGRGSLLDRILAALVENGKDLESLSVDDLSPVDAFHTRGKRSTEELAALAQLNAQQRVLDVGCGLGGSARHLASRFGCRVEGVDLTQEYIDVAQQLSDRVGLGEIVHFQQGNALSLPFEDGQFDVVWTEHVQMNIEDKVGFYAELTRVLKPQGKLVFHDVFRSTGPEPSYPVPWAEDESISFLATEDELRENLSEQGLKLQAWIVKDDESIGFFQTIFEQIQQQGRPPLGIHLLMGDNAREKLWNCSENLVHGRLTVAMGVVKAK